MPPTARARIRCTVAVWDPQLRETLRSWLAASPDVELLESPASLEQTPRALHQHQPDVVLVATPAQAGGMQTVQHAAACGPGLGVLVHSQHDAVRRGRELGFLQRNGPPADPEPGSVAKT